GGRAPARQLREGEGLSGGTHRHPPRCARHPLPHCGRGVQFGRNDMKIGFIGLGTMGASMAANLQKAGHELVVHDIRRAAAERHLAAGAVWADSPKALAAECEVIFTSLPGPPEVQEVALGPNGLLAGMTDGSAYFDLSTNSPTVVRELNRRFSEKHVYML